MTAYLACAGCASDGPTCEVRKVFAARIKGLAITSVKWKCADRKPLFQPGDAVWARTVDGPAHPDCGPYGEPEFCFADFPGIFVRMTIDRKALIYVAPGAKSEDEATDFVSKVGSGFCKLPFSRLRVRGATPEKICDECLQPASAGHVEGCSCAYSYCDGDGLR